MSQLERFGVSMDGELLDKFDALIKQRQYGNRSEAIRDLVRKELVEEQWTDPDAEVMGAVTIVYHHDSSELSSRLTEIQHDVHHHIVCTTHVHIDHHHCMEVMILKGPSHTVQTIANTLISTKGVLHGHLVSTTSGRDI